MLFTNCSQSQQASNEERVQQWISLQSGLRVLDVDLTPDNAKPYGVYTWASKARVGDHIAIRCVTQGKQDVAWHHGIFIGNDYLVHMHPTGNISKVTIDDFMATLPTHNTYIDTAAIVEYKGDSDVARGITAMIATHAPTDPTLKTLVYDVLGTNCDGFAAFCRTYKYDTAMCTAVCTTLDCVPMRTYIHTHPKLLAPAGGSLSR